MLLFSLLIVLYLYDMAGLRSELCERWCSWLLSWTFLCWFALLRFGFQFVLKFTWFDSEVVLY